MTGVLLLNASTEPLRVISLMRGVGLVVAGKADIVEESEDEVLRSERAAMPVPKIIKLRNYVRVPYRSKIPLTRKNLVARDHGKCGYCGKSADTIDHLVPRSRSGKHEWTNVVLACRKCNSLKAAKTLGELGWKLRVKPVAPMGLVWIVFGVTADPSWGPYLAPLMA
jgi:5-methylcytosine-specific restriction endonuclease McrA